MESYKTFISYMKKNPMTQKMFIGNLNKFTPLNIDESVGRLIGRMHDSAIDKKQRYLSKAHDHSLLSDREHDALENYTNDSEDHNNSSYESEHHEDHEHLDSAIRKYKAPRNMHVFSGLSEPSNVGSGTHFHAHLPAYTSTSLSPRTADLFSKKKDDGEHRYRFRKGVSEKFNPGNEEHQKNESDFVPYSHMAKIHIPEGSHGMTTHGLNGENGENDENDENDETGSEHEYLLHRNSQVRFKSTPTLDHATRRVIWHGKLMHDGVKPTRHSESSK